jgi:hypothetical protein
MYYIAPTSSVLGLLVPGKDQGYLKARKQHAISYSFMKLYYTDPKFFP